MTSNQPNDVDPFTHIHSLLNYKFESYHLAKSQSPPPSALFSLPNVKGAAPAPSKNLLLSFAEAQARARHNHLSPGLDGELVYVDADLLLTAVSLDQETLVPTFHSLLTLPTPALSSSIPEYPTAIALSSTLWAVSDGHGTIHLVSLSKPSWQASITASYTHESLPPFRIHSATLTSDGSSIKALISTTVKSKAKAPEVLPKVPGPGGVEYGSGGILRPKIESATAFDWIAVSLPLPPPTSSSSTTASSSITIEWSVRATDLPHFVNLQSSTPSTSSYLVGSSISPFSSTPSPSSQPNVTPSPSSSSSTAIPAPLSSTSTSTSSNTRPPPPPYSWTQDRESLTLVFAIPSTLPTSSIRVLFSKHFLTLHLASVSASLSTSVTPHISHKKLWDGIDPHSSVWTFDRDAEGRDSTYGLLSLHLEKENYGTRWLSVFSSSEEETEGEGGELDKVAETLDPSELANIAESMEQWTQEVSSSAKIIEENETGIMGGIGTSSITGDEMDLEIDAEGGTPLVVTLLNGKDGSTEPEMIKPHHAFKHSLLSLPLPLCSSSSSPSSHDNSIIIKHDVDGLLFLPPTTSSQQQLWTHTTTFPAIAFVLASKRNATFVNHFFNPSSRTDSVVIALTSGGGGAGNLFAYFLPEEEKSKIGVQKVLTVGGGTGGSVLGVAGVDVGEGKRVVVVLLEKELGVFAIWD